MATRPVCQRILPELSTSRTTWSGPYSGHAIVVGMGRRENV
jgi:hypothetical protein